MPMKDAFSGHRPPRFANARMTPIVMKLLSETTAVGSAHSAPRFLMGPLSRKLGEANLIGGQREPALLKRNAAALEPQFVRGDALASGNHNNSTMTKRDPAGTCSSTAMRCRTRISSFSPGS